MAAELAKPGQPGEDLDPVFLQIIVLKMLKGLRLKLSEVSCIQLFLLRQQLRGLHSFDFLRQLLQNIRLQTS
ncbi:hypothetical protein D3C85_1406560 [compost metagenome]